MNIIQALDDPPQLNRVSSRFYTTPAGAIGVVHDEGQRDRAICVAPSCLASQPASYT
jgi:hypothetical protein